MKNVNMYAGLNIRQQAVCRFDVPDDLLKCSLRRCGMELKI